MKINRAHNKLQSKEKVALHLTTFRPYVGESVEYMSELVCRQILRIVIAAIDSLRFLSQHSPEVSSYVRTQLTKYTTDLYPFLFVMVDWPGVC